MKILIIHELQSFIYGLRFFIALVIVMLMFSVSSVTYIDEYKENVKSYHQLTSGEEARVRDYANNASKLATGLRSYQLPPRGSSFISDCGETVFPGSLSYNAYYYIAFESGGGSFNPFVMPVSRINWGFIMLVLFGFLAVIFSFDAVSAEKEQRTLALCLSNHIKRSHILLSKFISINIMLITLAIIGMLSSLVILAASPAVPISMETILEVGLFLAFVVFFTGSMTAIAMFASVISHNSNISLLLSVSAWLMFMIAVPNFARTVGMSLYPVEKNSSMVTKMTESFKEIEASFPDGKWNSNSINPFMPEHEIRAAMRMAFAKSQADFVTVRHNEQFNQLEKTRKFAWLSPLAVFEYGSEAILDGGYLRLRKNYNDLQNFKIQYFQWFKDVDAKDSDSPHWYNAYEDYSTTKKPVAYDDIPKFTERTVSISERLAETMKYLMVMLTYMGIMLFLTILKFERYDVR